MKTTTQIEPGLTLWCECIGADKASGVKVYAVGELMKDAGAEVTVDAEGNARILDVGEHTRALKSEWIRATVTDRRRQLKERAHANARNLTRRMNNASLREICGTSARAAREDMGL